MDAFPSTREELFRLFDELCDERLPDDNDSERLSRFLLENEQVRVEYVRYMDMRLSLDELVRGRIFQEKNRRDLEVRGSGFGVQEEAAGGTGILPVQGSGFRGQEEAVGGRRSADSQSSRHTPCAVTQSSGHTPCAVTEAEELSVVSGPLSVAEDSKSTSSQLTTDHEPRTPSPIPHSALRIPHFLSRQPLAYSCFVATVATVIILMIASQIPIGGDSGDRGGIASKHLPVEFVAQITGDKDCVWGDRAEAVFANAHLRPGQVVHLESGLAEVTFKSGAVAVVEGPAAFAMEGRNRGRLERGKLVARVERKSAKGFTVKTPTATIVDLGTEFGVEVDSNRTVNVHVFEGRVSVESVADKGKRLVQAGESVVVDSRAGAIEPPSDSRSDRFVRKLPSTAPIEPEGLRRGLAAYWNFDGPDGEEARNVEGNRELDGTLIGGAKLAPDGKFSGALDLSSPGDYVKVSSPAVPDGATAYTVSAWFKPRRMDVAARQRLFETFRADGNEAWSISAELNDRTQVQYNIKATENRVVYRSSFVVPEVERWHHLAIVADLRAQGSWLYVNGEDRVEARGAPAGEFVPSTGLNIGTHRDADRFGDGQWFLGWIDDMAIWNRALSPREIAELWNNGEGRPVLAQP